jgi:hypothetical protein
MRKGPPLYRCFSRCQAGSSPASRPSLRCGRWPNSSPGPTNRWCTYGSDNGPPCSEKRSAHSAVTGRFPVSVVTLGWYEPQHPDLRKISEPSAAWVRSFKKEPSFQDTAPQRPIPRARRSYPDSKPTAGKQKPGQARALSALGTVLHRRNHHHPHTMHRRLASRLGLDAVAAGVKRGHHSVVSAWNLER